MAQALLYCLPAFLWSIDCNQDLPKCVVTLAFPCLFSVSGCTRPQKSGCCLPRGQPFPLGSPASAMSPLSPGLGLPSLLSHLSWPLCYFFLIFNVFWLLDVLSNSCIYVTRCPCWHRHLGSATLMWPRPFGSGALTLYLYSGELPLLFHAAGRKIGGQTCQPGASTSHCRSVLPTKEQLCGLHQLFILQRGVDWPTLQKNQAPEWQRSADASPWMSGILSFFPSASVAGAHRERILLNDPWRQTSSCEASECLSRLGSKLKM